MPDRHVVRVKVWGELACFTRPEFKVERVSYPVMTPSAARGVLDAILWKKEFRWHVRAIHVLRPVQFVAIRRNEVQKVINEADVKRWMADSSKYTPFYADAAGRDEGENRTQRNTLALRDVEYVVEASVDLPGYSVTDPPVKYREMFNRRVENGQCFHRPYLGCREFSAHFSPVDGTERPIAVTEDLGRMLWDLDYQADGPPRRALFFDARLESGVLEVTAPMPAGAQPEEAQP